MSANVTIRQVRNDELEIHEAFLRAGRQEDIQEWETASGKDFDTALLECLLEDNPKWVARVNGLPMMVFGVNALNWPLGNAWMIATHDAVEHRHALHRHHRESMAKMLVVRPLLHAWADLRNKTHLEWMERMGWEATQAVLMLGVPAHRFLLYVYSQEHHDQRCVSQERP